MLESLSYLWHLRVIFFIFRYFQRYWDYRRWHFHWVSAIRLGGSAHWWNEWKDQKNIKESKMAGAIFRWSLYLIINIREGLCQRRVETMMAKMNSVIDGKTSNPIFIFAGYSCEMEDFLLDSEPKSLKTNSKCPAVLYAHGTRRNAQQNSAYLWNELPPRSFRHVRRLFFIIPVRN